MKHAKTMKKLLTFAAVFAFGLTAFAQEDSTESAAGGIPPMGATAEVTAMSHLVGTWNAEFSMRMGPEAEWMVSPSTEVFESILDGCALRAHFSSTMMGMGFKGEATMTYDRISKKWQLVWTDNMGANQTMLVGEFVDGVMTLSGEGVEQGKPYLMRDITKHTSDTEFDWHMEVSYDNGENWYTNMKAIYKKAE
ncbi:DUF1579 family protein [Gemmatimonas aurantiaca]|nr:DUF1579 family protein [Gemmatimonas aurantiaca]